MDDGRRTTDDEIPSVVRRPSSVVEGANPNDTSALVLAIDIGSSSLRTNLYTADARRVDRCETQLPYPVRVTPGGGVEIDPDALLDCLFSALDGTLALAG